jgi:hypothetical protein
MRSTRRVASCDDCCMALKGFRPLERGELSIMAALVVVGILGAIGFFLQTAGPVSISQTAASNTATPPSINDQCVAGEVHSVSETDKTSTSAAKPQQNKVQCYIKDTKTGKMAPNPQTQNDPVCKDALADRCTVRYCPPAGLVKEAGTCIIIQCKEGDNDCVRKNLGYALGGNSAGAIAGLVSQNKIDVSVPSTGQSTANGSGVLSAVLSPQGKQDVLAQGDALKQDINAQIQAFSACAQATPAEYQSQCAPQLQTLQAQQAQLDQQLADLKNAKTLDSTTCGAGQTGSPPNCVTPPPGNPCPSGTVGCAGATPVGNGTGNTFGNGLNSLLNGLNRGLMTPPLPPTSAPVAAQACSTDPNTYAQQQQQYQQQLQQYNYQLQQAQYQQQMSQYYGGSSYPSTMPQQPVACSPSTQQQCSLQPQQPAASTCTGGSWQPIYSGSCIVNWQCSSGNAQLSCQPQTADVGMQLSISYSCAQGSASGSGFTATGTSGAATTTVAAPPSGTNTATYSLTCTNGAQVSSAQCSVQVNRATIVLVANPSTIPSGGTSVLGWVTSGMQSCVISAPTDPDFTQQNSSNTSTSGTATTNATSTTLSYLLQCATNAGGTKSATTTVTVQ